MNYFKLYFTYIKRSLISRLEYKKDTFISMFNFFITNVAAILSIYFVMETIPSLEGWSMEEIGFLYGFSMMPVALDHIFTDDLWNVSYKKVRNGEMDRMFLRPIPVLFQVIAETFQVEGFGELIVGIFMLVFCGIKINFNFSFSSIFLMVVATIFGALIITSLKILIAAIAFKTKTSGQLLQIIYNFIAYTRYPRKIYPAFLRVILTLILPFMLIISYPVEIALGKMTISPYLLSGIIAIVAIVFFVISIFCWRELSKRYESSGS